MSDSKAKLFINLFLKVVKGDDAEAQAARVRLQAVSALKAQISANKASREDLKIAVEEANEGLDNALVNNGNQIRGDEARRSYAENLLSAQNRQFDAVEKLEDCEATIKFLEEQLARI